MSPIETRFKSSRVFFIIVLILVIGGFFVFSSAALGKLGQDIGIFTHLAFKQFAILLVGLVLMILVSKIPYKKWRTAALPLLAMTLIGTALVFIPGLGIKTGGATRWIDLGFFSFQPAEFLKLGMVIYFAAWLASVRTKVHTTKWGLLPILVLLGLSGSILFLQPDIGTFIIITGALIAMYFVAGASFRDLGILFLIGLIAAGGLVLYKPYIRNRVMSFISPETDVLGSSYQINQSLIAIGSGEVFGRGFGQSLQKFAFLPQSIGDSIFAIAAEEFGFIGAMTIVGLFVLFGLWGLKIASEAPDVFGRLLVIGIVILILSQSFLNIGAMLGLMPLTGDPLAFISQGGTALLVALIGSGIILGVSRKT